MAERKRRIQNVNAETAPVTPTKTEGKILKNEVIYSKPSKESVFVGAVMAGEIVKILDYSNYLDGWIKIKTPLTFVTGYVDAKSVI